MAEELESAAPDAVESAAPEAASPTPPDKVKTLYDALSADHYQLGTVDEFRQKMADPGKAAKLYDAATADHYQLGDKQSFIGKMGAQPVQQDLVNQDSVGIRPQTNGYVSNLEPRVNSLKAQDKSYKPTLGSVPTSNKGKAAPEGMITSTIDMFKSLASLVPETASSALRVGSRLVNYINPVTAEKQRDMDRKGEKNSADKMADQIDDWSSHNLEGNSVGNKAGEFLKMPALIAGGIATGGAGFAAEAITPMLMAGSMHNAAYHEAIAAGAGNGGANLFATITASAGMLINGAAIAGAGAAVKGLAAKAIAKAAISELAESGATKITGEAFQKAVAGNASKVITALKAGGAAAGMEFGAGVASHEFDQGTKFVYDHIDPKVKFHIESFGENALAAAKQGGIYALTGALTGAGKVIDDIHGADPLGDHITSAIAHDPASADVMRSHADQLLANKDVDPMDRESPFSIDADQHDEIHQKIDRVEAINSSIPDHITDPEDRAKAIGIISQRNEVDNHIAALEEKKDNTDEGYHEPLDTKIEKLTEIRDGLNSSLKKVGGEDFEMPKPHDQLLGKDEDITIEPAKPEESVKDAAPEPVKEQDPNEQWEEDKQHILNNSSPSDEPEEYIGNTKAKSNFGDIVRGFRKQVGEVSGKYLKTLQDQVESLRLYHSKEGDGTPKIGDVIDRQAKELADLKEKLGTAGRVGGRVKGAYTPESKKKIEALTAVHQKELHAVIDKTQKEYESLLGEVDAVHAKNTYSVLKQGVRDKDKLDAAKKEFLSKTKELVGKLGRNAPANVKSLIPDIIKMSNGVHNAASLGKALDKMESHIDDIFQAEGERNATLASKKLTKTVSTFKGVDPRLTTAIQQLAKLGKKPKLLSDPHEYSQFARSILDKNGNLAVKTNDIERYVTEQMGHVREALKQKAIDSIQSALDKMEKDEPGSTHEMSAEEVYSDDYQLSSFFQDGEPPEESSAPPSLHEVLTNMIYEAQDNLPGEEGLTSKQQAVLRALKNIDPDNEFNPMSIDDKKILNFALHNINENGSDVITKGTDELVQYYLSNEIHKGIEASRKDFEGTYFNFLKKFRDPVRDIEGAKTPSPLLRMSKNKLTFNQAVKGLNPDAQFVRKVYGAYLKPFELDYGKAKGEITTHVSGLLHANKINGITREEAARIRIFTVLRQVNRSSPQSEDAQFQALKETIPASMHMMEKTFGGVKGDMYKRQSELIDILHKSGLVDLFTNHLHEITKDNMEELIGIQPHHWNVINYMDEAHLKVKPDIMDMYEKMGIDASDVHNYTHMDYLHVQDAEQVGMATRKSTEALAKSFFGKADIDNLGPHVTSRQDLAHTPKDAYLNLDLSSSFTRGMNKQLMSAYTISNRMLIHNVMADRRTNLVFDKTMDNADKKDTNAKYFKNLIHQNIGDAMGTSQRQQHGWMDAQNWATVLINNTKSLYYRGTLGSVFQYPKQYVESGTAAAIMLGDPAAYLHGMGFITNHKSGWAELKPLLIAEGSPVLRRMVDREDLHSSALDDAYTAESTGYADIHDAFTKKSNQLGEMLINPLKQGDAAVSLHTWISGYSKKLKDLGEIKGYGDFDQDFIKSHTLNKEAAAYADDLVERTNAKVEGPFRAQVLQNSGEKTLKTLFWNMKTFQLHANVEARLAVRNLMSGTDAKQSARQVLAYGASQVASGAMKYTLINPIRHAAAFGILYALMGEDKFNKMNEQRLALEQKGGRLLDQTELGPVQTYAGWEINNKRQIMNIGLSFLSDIALGSQNNITQGAGQFGADFLYKQLIYNGIQGQMEKAGARKSLFYSDNNFFGYGSYQGVVNGVINPVFGDGAGGKSIVDQIRAVATPADKAKLGAAQFIASTTQLFLGADAGRVAQMVNSNLQKYMENNEFKLSDYYEGLKTLVEKTGIPIKPIDLTEINSLDLRDEEGKELLLKDSQIKAIDRAYATQLKENLDPDELIAGEMDEAKEAVSSAKKDALKEALDEVLGEDSYKLGVDEKKEEKENSEPKPAEQYEVQSSRTY